MNIYTIKIILHSQLELASSEKLRDMKRYIARKAVLARETLMTYRVVRLALVGALDAAAKAKSKELFVSELERAIKIIAQYEEVAPLLKTLEKCHSNESKQAAASILSRFEQLHNG
ncbi:hypothetical protein M2G93_19275 [Vibrio vulnificus]|nr:hypothetical protein [Vibrio vulnificus]EHD1697930.1 hypothetical protein [Vibrio vulnificus]EKZ9225731.1 hypothetical protein [Vibrio vulnificus]ELC9582575.1 hypothetical protein [Vibrio vulnificus]MCU8150266.1 hypothetical protein [Vibrio vulnificus]